MPDQAAQPALPPTTPLDLQSYARGAMFALAGIIATKGEVFL